MGLNVVKNKIKSKNSNKIYLTEVKFKGKEGLLGHFFTKIKGKSINYKYYKSVFTKKIYS